MAASADTASSLSLIHRSLSLVFSSTVTAAAFAFACSCEPSADRHAAGVGFDDEDAVLIHAISEALRQEVDSDSIARMVNARASINSMKIRDRVEVSKNRYRRDPLHGDQGPPPEVWLKQAINVVYWQRPGTGRDRRIVGVAWYPAKGPEIFFAEIVATGDAP